MGGHGRARANRRWQQRQLAVIPLRRKSSGNGEHSGMSESGNAANAELASASARVQQAVQAAAVGLVEREVLVELIALAAVAEEHVLVLGEPGTAKSEAVRRVARTLG